MKVAAIVNYAGHGNRVHELSSEHLVKSSEVIFVHDGGSQHLFRQSAEYAWNESIIYTGSIISARTSVHFNVSNAIF